MLDFHPFTSENTHGKDRSIRKYDKQNQMQRLFLKKSVDNNFLSLNHVHLLCHNCLLNDVAQFGSLFSNNLFYKVGSR